MSVIVVDIECVPLDNAQDYLDPVQPDSRLTDPKKIEASIRERTEERNSKLGLDWNVGRICAIGIWTEDHGVRAGSLANWEDEELALHHFWGEARNITIVGFNILDFDLPYIVQRSRYLRVPVPKLDLKPWSKQVIDLYSELTFGKARSDSACMRRTLSAFAKRFGLPVTDDIKGKDIPALVKANDWESVVAHVKSDVELNVALAKVLGVITEPVKAVGAF